MLTTGNLLSQGQQPFRASHDLEVSHDSGASDCTATQVFSFIIRSKLSLKLPFHTMSHSLRVDRNFHHSYKAYSHCERPDCAMSRVCVWSSRVGSRSVRETSRKQSLLMSNKHESAAPACHYSTLTLTHFPPRGALLKPFLKNKVEIYSCLRAPVSQGRSSHIETYVPYVLQIAPTRKAKGGRVWSDNNYNWMVTWILYITVT